MCMCVCVRVSARVCVQVFYQPLKLLQSPQQTAAAAARWGTTVAVAVWKGGATYIRRSNLTTQGLIWSSALERF